MSELDNYCVVVFQIKELLRVKIILKVLLFRISINCSSLLDLELWLLYLICKSFKSSFTTWFSRKLLNSWWKLWTQNAFPKPAHMIRLSLLLSFQCINMCLLSSLQFLVNISLHCTTYLSSSVDAYKSDLKMKSWNDFQSISCNPLFNFHFCFTSSWALCRIRCPQSWMTRAIVLTVAYSSSSEIFF